nr:glycoside hydrolase family 97 N-terminal domain-containing protein [Formosa haliotis]
MKKILLIISLILTFYNCQSPEEMHMSSPNGTIKLELNNEAEQLQYSVYNAGKPLILNADISIFQQTGVKVVETKIHQVQNTWNPVWGQFSEIENHYNELEVSLDYKGTPATLFVRAYDAGVAFRFQMDTWTSSETPSFFMAYNLADSNQLYSPAGEGSPFGPISIQELKNKDATKQKLKMPLLVEGTDSYLSLLESDLISAPGFDVIKFQFDVQRNNLVSKNDFISDEKSLITPWRLILIEDHIGDLLTNTVPLNVAAENQIKNTSWIKPGKTLWDWRVHGYTTNDGFTYGIDNESYYRFIDFAAAQDIEYF